MKVFPYKHLRSTFRFGTILVMSEGATKNERLRLLHNSRLVRTILTCHICLLNTLTHTPTYPQAAITVSASATARSKTLCSNSGVVVCLFVVFRSCGRLYRIVCGGGVGGQSARCASACVTVMGPGRRRLLPTSLAVLGLSTPQHTFWEDTWPGRSGCPQPYFA